jgi:arginase
MRKIGIIGVPSSAGARQTGQEQATRAYRQASFNEHLRLVGLSVTDFGDLPEVLFRPDQQHPKAQNLQLVVEVAKRVANQVEAVVRDHDLPIVLGGDCTITLGVLAGLIRQMPNLGLIYFDGDVDLNTPDTTVSGIFDGMVMAHIIGKGVDELARVGPRYPLMAEENIVLFGYNAEAGWIDAAETQVLAQCQMMTYPLAQIRGTVKESAKEALTQLESKADSILIHFDVDVIDFDDFPAADVPHYQGISFDEAMAALSVFIASRKLAGLVITEFNADRDADGTLAHRFVDAVAKAMEKRDD